MYAFCDELYCSQINHHEFFHSIGKIFKMLIYISLAHLIFEFVMQNKNDNLSDRLAHEFHSVQLDGA